jgi:YD repeat-containing protein
LSPEHRLRRAPRVRAWLIVALLAPAVQAQDVDEAARIDAREDIIPVVRVRADRGPIDHLGWGTSEDLYVDLGAGAAVSVFSGNAVVHVPTFVRADLPADGRMALTYNHLDSGGSPELAPGWSWDLGRAVVPGAWGDRVLVDADGFRDSFFAGPPPSEAEAAELAEQVVRSWRRDTPPRQRRAAGGEAALRDLLASDPLFFGEMRARFLGAPPDPDPDAVWRSDQRGHRLLVRSEDRREQVLTRHDGGTEVYADAGHLLRVEPAVGLPLQLDRENGRLVGIDIDGRREVHVQRDSYDRVVGLRSAQGEDVDLRYVGPALHRVDTPRGAVRLTYDRAGRLVSMQGPDGGIDLTYDDRSGRLLRASGPRGRVTLGDLQGQEARLAVRAEVDGVAFDVAWDAERRTRTVTSGDSVQRVRFDELGLPRAVDDDDGSWTFDWDRGGRLLSAAAGDAVVRWERRDRGALAAVIDVGGQRAAVRLDGGSRVAGWSEPEGHRTDVTLDSAGRPQRLEHPGGRLEQVWRDRSGLLKGAEISGSGGVTLRRDRRGLLRAAESATGASVAVELDAAGRVARFEPPGGGRIELQHDAGGRLTRLLDGGTEVLLRSQDGWLAGWRGGHEDVAFDRAEDGRVTAVRSPAGAWSIQRSGARLDGLTFGGELRLDRDAAGRLTGWSRGTDGLRLDRDSDGLVVGWGTPAQGDVARRLDRGGRPVEISLPGARWLLSRDRSGRVRTVEAPAGGTWRLDRDDAGRIALIAGPRELRWRLERDAAGRLVGLRADGGTWSVRRDRAGRITDLTDPDGRGAVVILDRAGRWTELQPLGLRPIAANYSASGPTAVGDARRSYDPQGAVSGWGPSAPVGEWFVDRQADGLVATVGWRRGRSVDAQGAELRRRISRSGDVVRSGPWTLSGRDGRLDAVELAAGEDTSLRWAVRRDAAGRSEELEVPGGIAAAVSFGPAGDARSLRLDDVDWSFERDALGRVTSIGRGAARWSLVRDPLGRASAWTLLEPGGDAVDVRFDPLDGSRGGDTTIAEALGVQTDAPAGDERPSGSVRVEVDVAGGRLLAFDEVRSPLGRLAGVEGFWGTTGGDAPGELDVSVDPTLRAGGGLEPAADAIGDVLAELLAPGGADALVPRWGGEAQRFGPRAARRGRRGHRHLDRPRWRHRRAPPPQPVGPLGHPHRLVGPPDPRGRGRSRGARAERASPVRSRRRGGGVVVGLRGGRRRPRGAAAGARGRGPRVVPPPPRSHGVRGRSARPGGPHRRGRRPPPRARRRSPAPGAPRRPHGRGARGAGALGRPARGLRRPPRLARPARRVVPLAAGGDDPEGGRRSTGVALVPPTRLDRRRRRGQPRPRRPAHRRRTRVGGRRRPRRPRARRDRPPRRHPSAAPRTAGSLPRRARDHPRPGPRRRAACPVRRSAAPRRLGPGGGAIGRRRARRARPRRLRPARDEPLARPPRRAGVGGADARRRARGPRRAGAPPLAVGALARERGLAAPRHGPRRTLGAPPRASPGRRPRPRRPALPPRAVGPAREPLGPRPRRSAAPADRPRRPRLARADRGARPLPRSPRRLAPPPGRGVASLSAGPRRRPACSATPARVHGALRTPTAIIRACPGSPSSPTA